MTDINFNTYGHTIKNAPANTSASLYAKAPSGHQIGGVFKDEAKKGWIGLVSGAWTKRQASPVMPLRKDAQNWLIMEFERQEKCRSQDPTNSKYFVFATRNGCRASTLMHILAIFDSYREMVGQMPANNQEFSAIMSQPSRIAQSFLPYAIVWTVDKQGIRDRRFLCANEAPILEAMATFPKEVHLQGTIFLPLHEISDKPGERFHPVAAEITRLTEEREKDLQVGRRR